MTGAGQDEDTPAPGLLARHQVPHGAPQRRQTDATRHDHHVHTVLDVVDAPGGAEGTADAHERPHRRRTERGGDRTHPTNGVLDRSRGPRGAGHRHRDLSPAERRHHVELPVPEGGCGSLRRLDRERDHVGGLLPTLHHDVRRGDERSSGPGWGDGLSQHRSSHTGRGA